MSIILVSDVFGVTPALLEISRQLQATAIIDPYQGKIMSFKNESDAYSYFMNKVGLKNYLSVLSNKVKLSKKPITLVGFSVGASVVWRLSESKDHNIISQGFCYYGSQIRKFTTINPRFKINLVFPASEPHFDVNELLYLLSNKKNVSTIKVNYLHWFMNLHSENYSVHGTKEHIGLLCSAISYHEG